MGTANLLLMAIAGAASSGAVQSKTDVPSLRGDATYISVEATQGNIRSRIDVEGAHFTIRAVGRDPETGGDSHDGGLIWIEEQGSSYSLKNIGIELPKPGVSEWTSGDLRCERLNLSDDAYSSMCVRGETRFSYLVSKRRGVLSFTGFCFITDDRRCQYVLMSEYGVAASNPAFKVGAMTERR